MIIAKIIGGLGNQMFQYAAAQAVAISKGTTLKLDISGFQKYGLHHGFELTRIFNITGQVADAKDINSVLGWQNNYCVRYLMAMPFFHIFGSRRRVVEPSFSYWPHIQLVPNSCYMTGYWQSEKYFQKIHSNIKNQFTFKEKASGHNLTLINLMSKVNSVSLHIRRGDYVSNLKAASIHGVCPIEYYLQAIDYIENHVKNPYFFIFSDDIEWARLNLKIEHPHEFINQNFGAESYNDMRLMSSCKNNIIANSSFSWWGAWLNNNESKIVVAPSKWFAIDKNTEDLIPADWIKLSVKGS